MRRKRYSRVIINHPKNWAKNHQKTSLYVEYR